MSVFWADDLIYTGSSGRRIGKADILKDVNGSPPPKPGDPAVTYTAEEIRVQPVQGHGGRGGSAWSGRPSPAARPRCRSTSTPGRS
jgi:hypothetical protein